MFVFREALDFPEAKRHRLHAKATLPKSRHTFLERKNPKKISRKKNKEEFNKNSYAAKKRSKLPKRKKHTNNKQSKGLNDPSFFGPSEPLQPTRKQPREATYNIYKTTPKRRQTNKKQRKQKETQHKKRSNTQQQINK